MKKDVTRLFVRRRHHQKDEALAEAEKGKKDEEAGQRPSRHSPRCLHQDDAGVIVV